MTSATRVRTRYLCGCGQKVANGSDKSHEAGGKHQEWLRISNTVGESLDLLPAYELPEDPAYEPITPNGIPLEVQSIFDSPQSPVNKAKGLRKVFSYHDWPDDANPTTVRDYLVQAGIPIHETNEGSDSAGAKKLRVAWERENK